VLDKEFFAEISEAKGKLLSHIERQLKVLAQISREDSVKQFVAVLKCMGRRDGTMEVDEIIEHRAAQFVLEAVLMHGWEESTARGEFLVARVEHYINVQKDHYEEFKNDPIIHALRALFR